MAVVRDLVGRQFGTWTVTARADDTPTRASQWAVRCDCGAKTVLRAENLRMIRANQCEHCSAVPGGQAGSDVPPASVAAIAVADPSRPVSVRPPKSCQWPIGREGRAAVFCGADAVPGRPYCPEHCGVSYVAVPAREREDARIARQARAFMEPPASRPGDRP